MRKHVTLVEYFSRASFFYYAVIIIIKIKIVKNAKGVWSYSYVGVTFSQTYVPAIIFIQGEKAKKPFANYYLLSRCQSKMLRHYIFLPIIKIHQA
jgi:hypothetical protein